METMWYYTQGRSDQQGPVPQSRIQEMLQSGSLGPRDMVWREGMENWVAVAQAEEFGSTAGEPASLVVATGLPPRLGGWMSFVGVMHIIIGIFNCLTCVGLPVGIVMLLSGVALLGARTALNNAGEIGDGLIPFFEKLNTFMVMVGITYIIGAIAWVVIMMIYLGGILAFLPNAY